MGTHLRYSLTRICTVWRVPRSTVYARRGRTERPSAVPRKRGPRTAVSDAVLLVAIRAVLSASAFHTEGHRKVRVRLRPRGIYVGKARVLRLMRHHRLLAPYRRRHRHGDRAHRGTIITTRPNELWGTDATKFQLGLRCLHGFLVPGLVPLQQTSGQARKQPLPIKKSTSYLNLLKSEWN